MNPTCSHLDHILDVVPLSWGCQDCMPLTGTTGPTCVLARNAVMSVAATTHLASTPLLTTARQATP